MAKAAKRPKGTEPEIPSADSNSPSAEVVDPTSMVLPKVQPKEAVKDSSPEDEFKPVSLHFPHGFYCPPLQKSYKPGYYKVLSEQEFNFVRKYADNLK